MAAKKKKATKRKKVSKVTSITQRKKQKKPKKKVTKDRYKWTSPYFDSKADANAVGDELSAMEDESGALTKEDVVETARNPKSSMHNLFEWDIERAAQKHWEHTAMNVINSIRVVVHTNAGPQFQRFVVRVRKSEEFDGGYVRVGRVTEVKVSHDIMGRAIRELQAWAFRYQELRDRLPGFFAKIDDVIQDVKNKTDSFGKVA